MNLQQLRERMAAALTEARALGDKSKADGLSEDEDARLDTLIAEINDLGPKIEAAGKRAADIDGLAALDAKYSQPARPPAATLVPRDERGFEPNGSYVATAAERKVDARSIGRRFVESDAYKAYCANPNGKTPKQYYDRPEYRSSDDLLPSDGMIAQHEQRALLYTGATSGLVQPQILPGFFRLDAYPLRVRDLFLNLRTTQSSIVWVKETVNTNGAVEVPEATATSGGGFTAAAKPESGVGFDQENTPVQTIATWIPVTRQTFEDIPQMEGYINGRLMDFIRRREDAQILAGDGTGSNLTGVLTTSGIQVLNDAYFGTPGNELPTVGSAPTNLDRIRRGRTMIEVVGLAQPDGLVIHPFDREKFDELKDANGQYLMANPRDNAQQSPLWGVTVVESVAITPGTALMGAFRTMAAVYDRADIAIYVADQHADFFTHNLFVVLAESRLAVAVYRPQAFATIELEAA